MSVIVSPESLLAQRPGDAEIRQFDLAIARDKDVFRLDVPVDDTLPVGGLEGIAYLAGEFERLVRSQARCSQQPAQIGAIHIFHHEIEISIAGPAEIIHRDDARMLNPGQQPRLALESEGKLLVGGHLGGQ